MTQPRKFRAFRGTGGQGGGFDFDRLGEVRDRFGRFRLRWLIVAVLALVLVFTSFYTVAPEEVGVVLRFGRFAGTTDPGLHFKLPFGVDRVTKVPVERQLKQEFGFRTADAESGPRTRYVEAAFEDESLMLTGDLNIADVSWVVQYRVVDPYKYLFRVKNVTETFRAMSEAVMQRVVGDRTVNEVITLGREELASLVERELQELADQYETGIRVEQVVLQNVLPPDAVMPSFNEVNQAEQRRSQLVNTAEARYNEVVPRARGEAEQTVQAAEGYGLDRVNRARGEATRFEAVFAEYRQAPEVTRKRLYLETMARVVPAAGRKLIVDAEIENLTPLLDVGPVAPIASAAAATQGGGG